MVLKVGVVGMGPKGMTIGDLHAQSYKQDSLAELVGVCDVIAERADAAARRFGTKAYYSLEQMLDAHPDIDIIDVTTGGYENGSWHYAPTMQALEAGKHVLCEKPLSSDIGQAREMVRRANELDLYLGCNLNHYFTPPAERAMEYLRNGGIAEHIYCLCKTGTPGGESTYTPPTAPQLVGFPYFHMKAWLSHPFSVMRHFCGDVTHVQAYVTQPSLRKHAGDVMQSVNGIHVRFASGAIGYLLTQRGDVTFGLGGWWSFELAGTKGTLCIENCIEKITYWPEPGAVSQRDASQARFGQSARPVVTESGIDDFHQTFPRRIHAFLEDVATCVPKDRLRASGRDALAALECTWAAIESHEQGGIPIRPHPLPPLKGDALALHG